MNLTASRKHDILASLFGILDEIREEHITCPLFKRRGE
jgi:hypothetical protein